MRKSRSNTANAISSFVIMLVVLLSLGFLFVSTNGFKTNLKYFYVKCGNVSIYDNVDNFNIQLGKEYRFDIFNTMINSSNDYTVCVKSNSLNATNFDFTINGEINKYSDIKILSKGFIINSYEDYFTITANMDLPDILQLYYPDSTLSDIPSAINSNLPYFTLSIFSIDTSETININFNIQSEISL